MDDCCTYSLTEIGLRLGRSRAWMYANLAKLQRAGFPAPLPIVGRYAKMAVDAWIERQCRILDAATAHVEKHALDAAFNFG